MKAAIIHVPLWTVDTPHYSLCLVQRIFKDNDINVKMYELEIDFYHECQTNDKKLWSYDNGTFWDFATKHTPEDLFLKYKDFIRQYCNDICSYAPDIICFSINERSLFFTIKLLEILKKDLPNVITIAGGPSCFFSDRREKLMHTGFFDYICPGEAETFLPALLKKLLSSGRSLRLPNLVKEDQVMKTLFGNPDHDRNNNRFYSDFSNVNFMRYLKPNILPITMSRGCINRCRFCTESIYKRKYYCRSAADVIEEIKYQMLNSNWAQPYYVLFNDSLVNGNIEVLREFAERLIILRKEIGYGGMACVRMEMDRDFLKLLKESGCYRLQYGIESGSDKILARMGKGYTCDEAFKVIKDTSEAGISVEAFFIVGHPEETEEDFEKTCDFIKNNYRYIDSIYVNSMMILEGSHMHKYFIEYGVVKPFPVDWVASGGTNTVAIRNRRRLLLEELFRDLQSKVCNLTG